MTNPKPTISAELSARRTAAAAVLADYHQAVATADVADRALWGARLADMLGYLLGQLDAEHQAAAQFPAAAAQLAQIRLVLDAFDWKTDAGEPLAAIDDIVHGGLV